MTSYEFAEYIAEKTERLIPRRYGITTVEVAGSRDVPVIHIVNRDFYIDQSVPVEGPYSDFEAHGETEPDTYAQALAFELEYAMFDALAINQDVSKYADFNIAGEMLYSQLLDVERSREIIEGALGRKVDDYSVMVLYIHDGQTKTLVNEALVKAWGRGPAALFVKASENSDQYEG
ncbi:MAG TPA: hypothetical protein IAB23_05455 [Candidatus Scybalocola faecavium]|nr:hypothetical protein [Candidatus Scybalocola faecavium]